ncbi:MAG: DUF951 domain-containing protein [bacterium]|nr:MAG: DUF951 domain-containing protein [bacterium]
MGYSLLETKVTLKKHHPCGSKEFNLIRLGPEVVLRCSGCGAVVRMERKRFEKAVVRKDSAVSIQNSE